MSSVETKRLQLQWQSFKCIPNENLIDFYSCIIVGENKSLLSAEAQYTRILPQYSVSFKLYLPRPPFHEMRNSFETVVDVCQFIKGANSNRFIQAAYKSMSKSGNLAKKCPQPKGLYYFYNTSVGDYLPDFLPKTEFKVQLDFFTPTEMGINITLVGRLFEPRRQG
ncbi:uncharacterized protein LOC108594801 [Drosophila busckii]|uniref:uncharacterized protein LOC108594801 n=1 Tax=Drosophila busckii TaxID=30019 RepID=UPI00083F09E2|nr:uncharacterized protein LOC108594801 [Drosophila busckii]